MTHLEGRIERLGGAETRHGRMGDYVVQNLLLRLDADDVRETVYGTFFGQHVDALAASGCAVGDRMGVDALFTTSERNGFVTNYVEFRNPMKL